MQKLQSLHRFICEAKQVGMNSYWSAISLSNDRTPESSGVLS